MLFWFLESVWAYIIWFVCYTSDFLKLALHKSAYSCFLEWFIWCLFYNVANLWFPEFGRTILFDSSWIRIIQFVNLVVCASSVETLCTRYWNNGFKSLKLPQLLRRRVDDCWFISYIKMLVIIHKFNCFSWFAY